MVAMKSYKTLDMERERVIRHLEARGVNIDHLLYLDPKIPTSDLINLLSKMMDYNDRHGKRRTEFGI